MDKITRKDVLLQVTNPDKKAVIYRDEAVSYAELRSGVVALSNELKKLNIGNDDLVAIYMSNSIDMVISVFAVMNCNAAVLPINIDLPCDQISFIISESKPKVILHTGGIENTYHTENTASYCVNYKKLIKNNFEEELFFSFSSSDLAYCIFTSGSSGRPKGVLLTYEGILNHTEAKINLLNLTSQSRLCLSFNIGFVASIWQIIAPLLIGAQLFIYENDLIKNPYRLFQQLERDEIDAVSMIPQALYAYCHYFGSRHEKLSLPKMKHIILTGEKVDKLVVNKFYEKYSHISLINAYGQSECSDDTFHYKIPQNVTNEEIPIGKPVQHILYRILDENLNDVSIGEKGELYIGGICLAKSYLNNKTLTKEKFIKISGDVFFRTGDIAISKQNQDVVYLGRADNQLKIRGYLVEAEEVEAHLHEIPGIEQTVVLAKKSNEMEQILYAYYTSGDFIDPENIFDYLAPKLPTYMIPTVFKRVKYFLLNPNGKVDRKRIVECEEVKRDENSSDKAPVLSDESITVIQKRAFDVIVSNVREETSASVTLDSDFNSIGINSIAFIRTVVALESEFDFEFDDEKLQISEFPTIKSMTEYVASKIKD